MNQYPLHPDDVAQLMKIRRYLIGFRKTNGWSQSELSEMVSKTKGMAYDLESNDTWQWRLSRLQGWPVPFGLSLDMRLCFPEDADLEDRVHADPEVQTMYALSHQSHRWQRMYLTSALRVARKVQSITSETMGRHFGTTAKAITNWETSADGLMLAKVLHYARLLGGHIDLNLRGPDSPTGQ